MERKEKIRRLAFSTGSMVFGTILVLGTVVLINRFASAPPPNLEDLSGQVKFERKKKPEEKQPLPEPVKKPKPKHNPRQPPPPLKGLDTTLSGIDMGIPGFSVNDLDALNGGLLDGAGGMVMTEDTVDQPPQPTYQAPMTYPPRARAQGIEGYVDFSVLIGITGEIEKIEILESTPAGVFDAAALQGIQQWRFAPAMYQGQAVRAWAKQRVRFDLS
jgi:protein TonB